MEFITEILNGLTVSKYFAIVLYILLGVVAKYVFERIQHKESIKAKGGFRWGIWIYENRWRVILALIGVHIVAVFGPKVDGTPATIFVGFTSGITLDTLIDTFAKPKK